MKYIALHFEDTKYFSNYKEIGYWEQYHVYEIEDNALLFFDFSGMKPILLPSLEVAMGWLFAVTVKDVIKVGLAGPGTDYLKKRANLEPYKNRDKLKYNVTDEDYKNGLIFAKIILREKISRIIENAWLWAKPFSYPNFVIDYIRYSNFNSIKLEKQTSIEEQEYYKNLKKIYNIASIEYKMIDSFNNEKDVRDYLTNYQERILTSINDLLVDRETKNVQRPAKS